MGNCTCRTRPNDSDDALLESAAKRHVDREKTRRMDINEAIDKLKELVPAGQLERKPKLSLCIANFELNHLLLMLLMMLLMLLLLLFLFLAKPTKVAVLQTAVDHIKGLKETCSRFVEQNTKSRAYIGLLNERISVLEAQHTQLLSTQQNTLNPARNTASPPPPPLSTYFNFSTTLFSIFLFIIVLVPFQHNDTFGTSNADFLSVRELLTSPTSGDSTLSFDNFDFSRAPVIILQFLLRNLYLLYWCMAIPIVYIAALMTTSYVR